MLETILLLVLSAATGIFIGKIIYSIKYKKKTKEEIQTKILKECSNLVQKQKIETEKLNQIRQDILVEETKLSEKIENSSIIYKIKEEEFQNNYERNIEKYQEKIKKLKENQIIQIDEEIKDWARSAQEVATTIRDNQIKEFNDEIEQKKKEKEVLENEINDFRIKREAINQEILRSRAMEEKQDFYKIQIDERSIADINVLNSVRKELSKIDLLDKLIYDNYVSKPVNEMIKRVLNGRAPSGIYKITRLKTGEVYVGKSVDLKSRWQQHVKSAFHCGTISHSTLHTIMEKDGVWNFTFEMIEEVPKDELSKKEKYWINFYDSKKFGLNEREG